MSDEKLEHVLFIESEPQLAGIVNGIWQLGGIMVDLTVLPYYPQVLDDTAEFAFAMVAYNPPSDRLSRSEILWMATLAPMMIFSVKDKTVEGEHLDEIVTFTRRSDAHHRVINCTFPLLPHEIIERTRYLMA